ncbi:MAG: 3-hydroxybutyrate dehydrogenase [Neomegalonema sp.]|nr:3-hydroxybutyrate dehydrogenase [Neomegalonema sp.]
MAELEGKVAVVTGSTSGIGEGCARELAKAGATIIINDHLDSDESRAKADAIAADTGATVAYISADMSKGEDCVRLIRDAEAKFGKVDILVNNAGIQHVEKIEDFPPEKWDLVLAINLSSSFHTIRAAMGGMKERKWGRIVNIASAHGLTASPFKSAYVAAKHGLVGLTKTVALEGADFGVTCNAICPGYVWTPLVEGQLEDQMKAHGKDKDWVIREVMLQRQGMKEFATVEQMGKTAVFLASSGADLITGTTISVDGGWTAL